VARDPRKDTARKNQMFCILPERGVIDQQSKEGCRQGESNMWTTEARY
jgi:hypothetical protein